MENTKNGSQNIAMDMVEICLNIDRNIAIKGVRSLCRHLCGTLVYIPKNKKSGKSYAQMKEILCDAVGEHYANIMLERIMASMGRLSVYIPFEVRAFEDLIAEEIYLRSGEDGNIPEVGKDYGLSFTRAYKLWKKGRKINLERGVKK